MSGPLSGVRVLDITTVVMGPFATQILGELGADVIKIEAPQGDNVRHVGPMRHRGMGHMFLHMNRNKRSVVLDLKQPAGREALLRLAAGADVLIYNVRPQAMARLKLSYAELAAANPRIIYVGAFGFGQDGPYAARPAYDDLIQGMVGVPWLAVKAGATEPRYMPATLADRMVGLHAVYAVTAALYHRERTGDGQAVEVPMFECMAQLVLGDHFGGRSFEPPLGPAGYARVLAPFRKPFPTRDGYLCLLMYNDKQWRSFFQVIGREQMYRDDPRFNSHENRSHHIAEINEFVAGEVNQRTTAEWLAVLTAADIPVTAMNSIDDLIDDEHLHATGFIREAVHPTEGAIHTTGIPSKWSRSQPSADRPAPRLGEHSIELLHEAGYSPAEIEAMLAAGVTATPSER
ncbi:MAG: CoA transferase [Betaproteobacteria bacterium]|nr:CoA transferase [Betaproteobacteria bacterium]